MHRAYLLFATAVVLAATSSTALCADVLEITKDTTLDPAKTYGAIVIKASNVTVDGRGAWLIGAKDGKDGGTKPKDFKGTAIYAKGMSNVTLVDVNAKGWETGLLVEDGEGWVVEDCNFSDNFHDPDFGWGENGRRGGIVLNRVSKSRIARNRANRVWDACVLVGSDHNTITGNDFSRTSNTCLKMWNASHNVIENNNLSYGIRKNPGEVHARDSTSVLIESGSNHNRMVRNNCRGGGDGIFVRVLNGWVSTDNYFEENDCSYANNNCIEAWSPRNTYVRNKCNYGSYGLWLGASDQTVLIGNEASYNGLKGHNNNSPHLPDSGHAGIVFMFGPSSHTICRENKCVGNNGAGIAAIGDLDGGGPKWKAFHWIIERNTLKDNRWGVYLKNADWITVAANRAENNKFGAIFTDDGVTNLINSRERKDDGRAPPKALLVGPSSAKTGEKITLDASGSSDPAGHKLDYRWDLGDGTIAETSKVEHVFMRPGFYRVGLSVHNGIASDLAWRDFYVVEPLDEIATDGEAAKWAWDDNSSKVKFSDDAKTVIAGKSSLAALVEPYGGGRVNLRYPADKNAAIKLDGKNHVVFWMKAINENLPSWQDVNPVVTLYEDEDNYLRLAPKKDLLSSPPYIEAREGWTYVAVPLARDENWTRDGKGKVGTVKYFTIGFDSWGAPPLRIWVDGLGLK
jgi:parallel beta-helix repeat protein